MPFPVLIKDFQYADTLGHQPVFAAFQIFFISSIAVLFVPVSISYASFRVCTQFFRKQLQDKGTA